MHTWDNLSVVGKSFHTPRKNMLRVNIRRKTYASHVPYVEMGGVPHLCYSWQKTSRSKRRSSSLYGNKYTIHRKKKSIYEFENKERYKVPPNKLHPTDQVIPLLSSKHTQSEAVRQSSASNISPWCVSFKDCRFL